MDYLRGLLRNRGIEFVNSPANFLMTVWPTPHDAQYITEELLHHGVIVRSLAAWGLPHCVRISVGTEEELAFFGEALTTVTTAESVV